MKDAIAAAAATVLLRDGLGGWSMDRVATEAGCAKGLVNYHHGNKKQLLATVAVDLFGARLKRRLVALDASGAEALDRLWRVLTSEVRDGEWAAWVALAAEPGIPSPERASGHLEGFAVAIGRALEVPALSPDEALLAEAALDGFQLALQLGADEASVREAYHRLWLAFFP